MADEIVTQGTNEGTGPAPAAPAAGAPAPAAAAPAPAPAPAAAAAPAAPSAAEQELAAFKGLGLSPEQLRLVVEERRELERQYRAQEEQTPAFQQERQRAQTFMSILRDAARHDPQAAAILRAAENLPAFEVSASEAEYARIHESRSILKRELKDAGIDTSKAEDVQEWEDAIASRLNTSAKLNAMYFNPETRAKAIAEVIGAETSRINRLLQSQGATDLKTAAARRASVPRPSRGGSLATVGDITPKSTNPRERRQEWRKAGSSALDAVFDSLGM